MSTDHNNLNTSLTSLLPPLHGEIRTEHAHAHQSLTPHALRLLSRELVTLRAEPPEGVRVVVDEDDISALDGWVEGPRE